MTAQQSAKAATAARVVFLPSGRRGEFAPGTTVLEAARVLGVDVDSVCGGKALCGRCQVQLSVGEFAKLRISSAHQNLSEPGTTENKYRRLKGLKDHRRLGCQAELLGDVVIDVPEESQIHRQVVRKSAGEIRNLQIDPVTRLCYVELMKPGMDDQRSDLDRLAAQLAKDWGIEQIDCDPTFLGALPHALRAGEVYGGDFKATVAIREDRTAIAVWPGYKACVFGIAIDVGTTTVAGHLCALDSGEVLASAGLMNPQIRFGEDLMSRISYLQQNQNSAPDLTATVREALARLVRILCEQAGIDHNDVVEITLVGNPTMHHLVLGIDPTQLGMEPFPLVVDRGLSLRSRDLGLPVNPGGYAYFLPCIAGHVGADTAGVILSQAPHAGDEMTLVIDVGTNAEIVLGHKARLIACSSPTGPAFEGAQITCGQRAAPGAIERVRIDRLTLRPKFKVIGVEQWSDQDGFSDAMKSTGVTGICGSGIIEAVAELYLCGIISHTGRMQAQGLEVADHPNFIPKGRNFEFILYADGERVIRVTPGDVRAIQLAKAACYSGTKLLMDRMGTQRIDRIYLAGAFGSYIDVGYAMAIGLIPDCDITRVASAGNAAGTGARIALLSRAARTEIERVARQVEKVETAIAADFQDYFVAAINLPHASDPFPRLEAWLIDNQLCRK